MGGERNSLATHSISMPSSSINITSWKPLGVLAKLAIAACVRPEGHALRRLCCGAGPAANRLCARRLCCGAAMRGGYAAVAAMRMRLRLCYGGAAAMRRLAAYAVATRRLRMWRGQGGAVAMRAAAASHALWHGGQRLRGGGAARSAW